MQVEQAVRMYLSYLKDNTRPNTVRSFSFTLNNFSGFFPGKSLGNISESEIIDFISNIAGNCSPSTKNSRVSVIRAFYNFIIEIADAAFPNPCLRPMIRKLFKNPRHQSPKLLDKDLIDEIIFRTTNERNRLVLELMGRAGMRIGEVLNIRNNDINFDNSTILVTQPKSGRQGEKVYITKKLAAKLQSYVIRKEILSNDLLFTISYSTAYRMVRNSGRMVKSFLRPHDLRRHAATQASRRGMPLEIVSKVVLRHADIATTQRYLGKIDQDEARRWVEAMN